MFYKILFFNTLIMGTLITISSFSWFSMWIGLEINLLSMIPLMSNIKNNYSSELTLKYFITQTLASIILLFSIIMSLNLNEFIPQNLNIYLLMIINSSLFTKMGAAPFHSWFPEVMEGLDWMNSLIMLTWQKIAPMILLMNFKIINFFLIIIIISSMISGIIGLNQISMRKLLTYSSINHISWMLASMLYSQVIWMIYFLIYSIITLNLIYFFKNYNIYFMKQLFMILNYNKLLKIFFIMNFLSLGGLPPFLGFFSKWLVINNLILNNFYFISFFLILFTLISLFFYMRIMFSNLIINLNEILIYQINYNNFWISMINLISLMSLMISIMIFSIY